jgi:hypothetical protein
MEKTINNAFVTPDMLVDGNDPMHSSLVKTLTVACDAKNGAPTLTIYYLDERIQPAEFCMDVKSACRLFASLATANKEAQWERRTLKEHLPSKQKPSVPSDMKIIQCGIVWDAKLRVDMDTGNTRFTIDLRRGDLRTLEFTLDPALCLSLMIGLYDLYELFGWRRSADARSIVH